MMIEGQNIELDITSCPHSQTKINKSKEKPAVFKQHFSDGFPSTAMLQFLCAFPNCNGMGGAQGVRDQGEQPLVIVIVMKCTAGTVIRLSEPVWRSK